MTLPPGQRLIDRFPRFGTNLTGPPPDVCVDPVIEIRGAVRQQLEVPLTALAALPRRELTADFHCVAGWSTTGLHWEGVPFETVYRTFVEAALSRGASVTHFVFRGLDGYRSIVTIDDALADDVLIADRLNGRPLDGEHGAPARLLSPGQYGYMSTKHLCRIEVHTTEPRHTRGPSSRFPQRLLAPHPRARVAEEERHRYLPGWSLRHVYRVIGAAFLKASTRGAP
jgi:DMSO/TMAO reductase YedYZ molybdopterin-dependent catalytic subunit